MKYSLLAAILLTVGIVTVYAQTMGGTKEDVKLTAHTQAAAAFDRGLALQQAGKFREAAAQFKRAYQSEPSMAALMQTARSYWRAGDRLEATRLSLEVSLRYPDWKASGGAPDKIHENIVCIPYDEAERFRIQLADTLKLLDVIVERTRKNDAIPDNPF